MSYLPPPRAIRSRVPTTADSIYPMLEPNNLRRAAWLTCPTGGATRFIGLGVRCCFTVEKQS